MAIFQVRPFIPTEIGALVALNHDLQTDYVWKMDFNARPNRVELLFQETRLPRSMVLTYPRPVLSLADNWGKYDGILVAELEDGKIVGYITLDNAIANNVTHSRDLVVGDGFRRKGIGTGLIIAAMDWAVHHGNYQLILEMQSKNHPAISLANKLGFNFTGYSDRHFPNLDIALFFGKSV